MNHVRSIGRVYDQFWNDWFRLLVDAELMRRTAVRFFHVGSATTARVLVGAGGRRLLIIVVVDFVRDVAVLL